MTSDKYMGTRTVRLDRDAENSLTRLRKQTGLSISEVLKRGMKAYEQAAGREGTASPYEIYVQLGLTGGGWSLAPANKAKQLLRRTLKEKHRK
jgi:hypothetical protein